MGTLPLARGLCTCPLGTSQSPAWAALQGPGDRVGQWCEYAVSTCLGLSTVSEFIEQQFSQFGGFNGSNVLNVPSLLDGEEDAGFCFYLNY